MGPKVDARALLSAVVSPFVRLDDDELDRMAEGLRPLSRGAGEPLLEAEALPRDLVLIREGLVRTYDIEPNGREVNLRFLGPPNVAAAMSSLIEGAGQRELIEAVTPVVGYRFSRQAFERSPHYERLMRILVEQHYLSMERRLRMLQIPFARDRYAFFAEHLDRAIVQGMPDYHVASYLGVTPETLSRAKRKLSST